MIGRTPSIRSRLPRVLVGAVLLVTILFGVSAHLHVQRAGDVDRCVACAAHQTAPATPIVVPVAAAPVLVTLVQARPRAHADTRPPLAVAPKTSPPSSLA